MRDGDLAERVLLLRDRAVLTAEQRDRFEERGVLELRGAVDPRIAADLRERVLAFVAKRGLEPRAGSRAFRSSSAWIASSLAPGPR